jgi:phosphoribosyl-ATP pyrophosphohydrolase/phosphoribosyl-AMP cyclohydrolase
MTLDFNKENGLIPVIIQHYLTQQVLMLGYMNEKAYKKTIAESKVTFFSRSKQRLWTKGETSGNYLHVVSTYNDCDKDALLIEVNPTGPTCHTGSQSCFNNDSSSHFLYALEQTIEQRIQSGNANSYTNTLIKTGINKVAQKVGEEAIELVIEAKDNNLDLFRNEAADLLYHFLILLKAKGTSLSEVEKILKQRASK